MTQVAFVSCSKLKGAHKAPAAALYTSALFRKSLLAAYENSKKLYIISAKHGVLNLGDIIEPYDRTLKAMSRADRNTWAETTTVQLAKLLRSGDVINFYCGEEYIAPLRRKIEQIGARLVEPLSGLSLGKRLQHLSKRNNEDSLKTEVKRFYEIMERLWVAQQSGRRIADLTGKQAWPERGVYFVTGAVSADHTRSIPRIIRVGTHAVSIGSRTTLWNRISTHRGTVDGGGSHRSSIFRSHVGRALMNSEPHQDWPENWAQGQSAPKSVLETEVDLEQKVSRTIGEMRLLWLQVSDIAGPSSDRAYLERNAIGLLSRSVLLSPSLGGDWLGNFSDDWRIAASGLWNLNHLFIRPDPSFLDVLERYVNVTLGKEAEPENPIAPHGWHSPKASNSDQLKLFTDENAPDV